jgi:hypothetical protein
MSRIPVSKSYDFYDIIEHLPKSLEPKPNYIMKLKYFKNKSHDSYLSLYELILLKRKLKCWVSWLASLFWVHLTIFFQNTAARKTDSFLFGCLPCRMISLDLSFLEEFLCTLTKTNFFIFGFKYFLTRIVQKYTQLLTRTWIFQ